MADVESRIAALEHRVQEMEDINAIRRLHWAYGYYIDFNRARDVANLFAEDGEVIFLSGIYKGREGAYRLTHWHDLMMRTQLDGCTTDPLWTVMQEGGPFQGAQALEAGLDELRHLVRQGLVLGPARRPAPVPDDVETPVEGLVDGVAGLLARGLAPPLQGLAVEDAEEEGVEDAEGCGVVAEGGEDGGVEEGEKEGGDDGAGGFEELGEEEAAEGDFER